VDPITVVAVVNTMPPRRSAKGGLTVHRVTSSRRLTIRAFVAALLAALILTACTVEQTPDGVQVCWYTSAGIACTLTPFDEP
jgi:hypothetical protein